MSVLFLLFGFHLQQAVERYLIQFISVVDNADTDNKGNKKSRQINGLINEWYLEDMSENIKAVLTNHRQQGLHIGAFALYGYIKDPNQKGHLIIDEDAAAVVREVFTLFSQGYGKTNIARILNERGIPNPTEYKRLKGLRYQQPKSKNSTIWKYSAIADMLINEIYIGNMVQGKYGSVSYKTKQNKPRPRDQWYIVENTHEPIIERELWDKVQKMVAQKAKPCCDTGSIGIFAKKVRCSFCGYVMRTNKLTDGARYFRCQTRYYSKESCPGGFISLKELEQDVLDELKRMSENYLDSEKVEKSIEVSNYGIETKAARIRDEIKKNQSKSDEYRMCIKNLYVDKVKGIISEQDYIDFAKDFSEKETHHERIIQTLTAELDNLNSILFAEVNKKTLVEQYANLEHLDRAIVEKLIDYITVGKRNPETKKVPIEIHWNF